MKDNGISFTEIDLQSTHKCDVYYRQLTHWGRVTHICVGKQTIIGSDNGLSPGRRQAIIWTNDGILLIGPLGTKFDEILIEIDTFSFKEMHLKMSSGKWRPFCLGLNVLKHNNYRNWTHIVEFISSELNSTVIPVRNTLLTWYIYVRSRNGCVLQ